MNDEYIKLPPVTELDTETRQRVIALLESLDQLTTEKGKILDREDDLKNELASIQKIKVKNGFRHGLLCFTAQSVAGRRTLDKELLLENGCPAVTIAQSYKTGAPSIRRVFAKIEEK